jgi:hypothetical protein
MEIYLERAALFKAHERYAGFRAAAREATEAVAWAWLLEAERDIESLELTEIDDMALEDWRHFWPPRHPGAHYDGNYPWHDIMSQLRANPRRLDLAMWANERLCGLCAGATSKNKANVSIHFLERYHGPNPMAGFVLHIAVHFAESYARVLGEAYPTVRGRQRLTVRSPTHGALPTYESLGFRLVERGGKARFCEREVGN